MSTAIIPNSTAKTRPLYDFFKKGASKLPERDKFKITLQGDNALKISSSADCTMMIGAVYFGLQNTQLHATICENGHISQSSGINHAEEMAFHSIWQKLTEMQEQLKCTPCALVRFFDNDLHIIFLESDPIIVGAWHSSLINISFKENQNYIFGFSSGYLAGTIDFYATDTNNHSISYSLSKENRLVYHEEFGYFYELSESQLKSIDTVIRKSPRGYVKYNMHTKEFEVSETCFSYK